MSEVIIDAADGPAIPVHLVRVSAWEAFAETQPEPVRSAAALAKFTAKAGQLALAPTGDGAVERVLFGLADDADAMALRGLAAKLPPGDYAFAEVPERIAPGEAALAWALGTYRFDRY